MINIHDGQITDLLNNALRYNPETISIGYAILQEKRRILSLAERTRLMSAIDVLEERILDYLSVELRTPAYEDSLPLDIKRTLIKGTLLFYSKLGTPAAVDWVVNAIFGNGGIEEWFEYDGAPHHFRVNIPIAGMITPHMTEELRRMIADVKRLTSWLDSIVTNTPLDPADLVFTGIAAETYSETVLPELRPTGGYVGGVHLAAAGWNIMETALPELKEEGL